MRAIRRALIKMGKLRFTLGLFLCCSVFLSAALAQQPEPRTTFRVKYAAEGAVYLDGGKSDGLAKGMKLTVRRPASGASGGLQTITEIEVTGLGTTSAVCEIHSVKDTVRVGDLAYLSLQDLKALQAQGPERYPLVVSFTDGDPLDEEQREKVPHPPSPEVNRIRGRIGVDYNTIRDRSNSAPATQQLGLSLRADMTRIGGSYWNFTGYWRGRVNTRPSGTQQQTLTDLINRTYQLGFTYNNPQSRWVMGLGRLYLPWATSLSTIDGGYIGRRVGRSVTLGMFGGSTPDPSAWNYNPNRQIAGSFLNYEGGSFESLRFTSTFGAALTRIHWRREREFAFFENGIFYKRILFIYHSLEADLLPPDRAGTASSGTATPCTANPTPGKTLAVSQSFLTVRVQPHARISFDLSHNYFRNVPTFDARLVGTGLVEKFLFEGFSGGVRVELPHRFGVYSSLGRSSRSGDTKHSFNQMYGVTQGGIWRTGIRADLRYSKFDSSFGQGTYKSLSLSRQVGEQLRIEVLGGQQNFFSLITHQNRARWLSTNLDWFIGRHFFWGAGFTLYRGDVQRYDQLFFTTGYRF